jgi:hypothetical protein
VKGSFQLAGTRFDTPAVACMSPAMESPVRPLDGSRDQRFVLISGLVFSFKMSENRAADGRIISSSSSTYFRFDQEIIHGQ